ncbi:MAG TPA: glycoside hydrolase family 2 protein, partial [Rectinemataceae bacterium]|nr:glycoside hydrolase family 2 protein [Rectinemataceae bacterium]
MAGTWTLSHNAGAMSLPMAVPGDILSALVESGLAPDPYIGTNEASVQWVGKTDWTIERDFTLSASFVSLPRIFLDIEVLDTIAEVRINNSLAGRSDNMFVRFRRDVAQLLHPGENHIAITIYSPEKAAAERADRLPYAIPESTYPVSSPHRNLLRKVQCMAGWDWGPCLMTGGIYDGIALTATDGPRIDYLRTRIKPAGSDFSVSVCAEVNVLEAMDLDLSFSLAGQKTSCRQKVPKGDSTISREIVVRDPEFWWPNEMGEQALYELVASAEAVKPGSALAPHVLRKKIGFRELRVSTEEDAIGREMKIVVNGHDVFAKGANWIPADALPSRWTDSRIEGLLRSAAAVHINCLRVWGGGRYESDAFYELCDRLGIMVWQDCMFSCALYPSAPDFLESVEKEIRHQVKRLADHPSLALWCGNNEALGAITWYEESRKSPARYIVDYDRLTEGVLGRTIRELDPDRCWWPSSPSAGPKDFSDNWHSDERGDMHFWSVWHEGKAFSEYLTVKPRFCSEFGFQSFPSHRTIEGFAPPDERNISSPAMEAHQRHPRGNSLIVDTILRYFRMPKGFRETLYLSQVQQAMAIKTAVEFWRSNRPRCMGALYWQLNDVWPVTSWSSLEYDGSWKLLHYEANRFYDPL